MSSDETSEQSSVRNGAGYDEVFDSGDEFKGFSRSSRGKRQSKLLTMMSRVTLRKMRR